MREIKFRGKRVDNGEWVYGNYFIDERDIEDGFIWRDIPQIQQRYGDHFQYFDVDPPTVGQYTGLKDKNGTEIYEGDIVKVDNGIGYYGQIVWQDCAFVILPNGRGEKDIPLWRSRAETVIVIGNKWDNPKLLKE